MRHIDVSKVGKVVIDAKKATDGLKTVSGGLLLLLLEGFTMTFPKALDETWESYLSKIITWLIYTGVIDRVWRDRDKIIKYVKQLFKTKSNG